MNKPSFAIDPEITEQGRACASRLVEGIYQIPEVYLTVVTPIGSTALQKSLQETMPNLPERQREASENVNEYLDNRYDRDVEYDEESEAFLDENIAHKSLLTVLKSQKPSIVKRGSMVERHEHPESDATRQRISSLRLELFVGRVIEWQANQAATNTLRPSA